MDPTQTTPAPDGVTTPPPVTPPAQPWNTSILGEDGKFTEGWTQKLPDSLAEYRAMAANYPDLQTLLKSHRDSMTAARLKGIAIPAADATEEQKNAFQAELRKSRGVPDNADGYQLTRPEGLPENIDFQKETAALRELAHKHGWTAAETDAIIALDIERQKAIAAEQQAQDAEIIKTAQAEMTKRWGDKPDQALNLAARAGIAGGLPPELFNPKNEGFIGNSPIGVAVIDAFKSLAEKLGESKHIPGSGSVALSPEDMARDIMTNPNNPDYKAYNDSSHPNSAAVRARVQSLWQKAA